MSRRLNENQIVVVGNGSANVVCGHANIVKKGQRFISNSGIASMGYGLPASIGACVADHSQDIILITGDGSIQFHQTRNIGKDSLIAEKRIDLLIAGFKGVDFFLDAFQFILFLTKPRLFFLLLFPVQFAGGSAGCRLNCSGHGRSGRSSRGASAISRKSSRICACRSGRMAGSPCVSGSGRFCRAVGCLCGGGQIGFLLRLLLFQI